MASSIKMKEDLDDSGIIEIYVIDRETFWHNVLLKICSEGFFR